jgi:hypothetical protein
MDYGVMFCMYLLCVIMKLINKLANSQPTEQIHHLPVVKRVEIYSEEI